MEIQVAGYIYHVLHRLPLDDGGTRACAYYNTLVLYLDAQLGWPSCYRGQDFRLTHDLKAATGFHCTGRRAVSLLTKSERSSSKLSSSS